MEKKKPLDDFIDEALNSNEFVEPEEVWAELEKIIKEAELKKAKNVIS